MDLQINFPVECLEDVFFHLTGKDLLVCTLVCPEWNNLIGTIRSCLKKIKFKYRCYFDDRYIMKSLSVESNRKYECLDVAGRYDEKMQEGFSAKRRKWTHVSSTLDFETTTQFYDFLRIFQSSVEKLTHRLGLPAFRFTVPVSVLLICSS